MVNLNRTTVRSLSNYKELGTSLISPVERIPVQDSNSVAPRFRKQTPCGIREFATIRHVRAYQSNAQSWTSPESNIRMLCLRRFPWLSLNSPTTTFWQPCRVLFHYVGNPSLAESCVPLTSLGSQLSDNPWRTTDFVEPWTFRVDSSIVFYCIKSSWLSRWF